MSRNQDPLKVLDQITYQGKTYDFYNLKKLPNADRTSKLPKSIQVLLEASLRNYDNFAITESDIERIASWSKDSAGKEEIPFKPARVVLQDFTGVPAVVDLAALRNAMTRLGGDPKKVNPQIPVDLVIDHSVQVDEAGTNSALEKNIELEFQRNQERYEFLKWGSQAFENFRAVPPATGIIHQVNLEYLSPVVWAKDGLLYNDSLVGTDSHTTMINGIGVLGWGVGGIEAEAVMLGQPIYMLLPEVVGFELTGKLTEGVTATDLVLRIVEMLRKHGVVGKFVEFYGDGVRNLSLANRATIANMAPEYGATMGYFPIDEETLNYMAKTGRSQENIDLTRAYLKAQGMFLEGNDPVPEFCSQLSLNISEVVPSLAGPKRPQDRIELSTMKETFQKDLKETFQANLEQNDIDLPSKNSKVNHGMIAIAAITSCTNTSNPSVLIGAGLLAKKAVEKGLRKKGHVKTSLAPGSRAVTSYLEKAGLDTFLDQLGFQTVGYGCTTCIGNSGPLDDVISKTISDNKLIATSVLSGNRNFEGRIHAQVQANYLASPPLVVAYALVGNVNIDLTKESLGKDKEGHDVFLKDIWPSNQEIESVLDQVVTPDLFKAEYDDVFNKSEEWNKIQVSGGDLFDWKDSSTYIRQPSFFDHVNSEVPDIHEIKGAKVLAKLADSVTTDHISPAGSIADGSPAALYLEQHGVSKADRNSYGSRRGNHEVMMRGTLANIRIRNELIPGVTGGYTIYHGTGEQMSIYDAGMKYIAEKIPSIILAGKEYGTGSSRDWAAKGVFLQGVKAVIAESYERIHRSNLIGMGVLPLQFKAGEDRNSLGLDGTETYSILGLNNALKPGQELTVELTTDSGDTKTFQAITRIDTPVEVEYYRNGGILNTVLRKMAQA